MRVTQSLIQTQFLSAISNLESNLSQTQNQLSSNQNFTTASQNPAAAGTLNSYTQALAQSQQFVANSNSAQSRLSTEDNTLSQVQSALHESARPGAGKRTMPPCRTTDRQAIASQAVQLQNTLLDLANTQDGNGEYLFGGYSSQTQRSR